MGRYIDLHTHTTASDGSLSPGEVVAEAGRLGLAAVGITDHDNTDGIATALAAGDAAGRDAPEVVPGLELSVWRGQAGSLHVLGYWMDPDHPELTARLGPLRDSRAVRNRKILERLEELGVGVDPARVEALAGGPVVGRPHLAQAMIEAGRVATFQEAFDRFLARGRPAYVERERLTPGQAVEMLHSAGGVAVLAHPGCYEIPPDVLQAEIQDLVDRGLDGIEAHYPEHSPAQTTSFLDLADRCGLAVTGGSDFHGAAKPENPLGQPPVPAGLLENLRLRLPK